jgi:hypothetical protein
MTAPALLRPTSAFVAVQWAKLIPNFAANAVQIASRLPKDDTPLRGSGFVRMRSVGGVGDVYVPRRNSVVVAECWAAPGDKGSTKLPLGRAGNIAEWLWEATYDHALMNVVIDFPIPGYPRVAVKTVEALSVPDQIDDPNPLFARFDLNLLVHWTLWEGTS